MKKVCKNCEIIKRADRSDVLAFKGYDKDIGVVYLLHKIVRGKDVFTFDRESGKILHAYQKARFLEQKTARETQKIKKEV